MVERDDIRRAFVLEKLPVHPRHFLGTAEGRQQNEKDGREEDSRRGKCKTFDFRFDRLSATTDGRPKNENYS